VAALTRISLLGMLAAAVPLFAWAAGDTTPSLRDMGPAVPARDMGKLPSTTQQYQNLQQQLQKGRPAVSAARAKSEALKAQAARLKRKLIDTAARVQYLEAQKIALATQITKLAAQERVLAASFARDRVAVTHLLAILERLQTDTPPAMAMKPNDALGAARGAMAIGASLPRVYDAAAALARKLEVLRKTRAALIAHRADAARNAAQLSVARVELNQLLAMKELQAQAAASRYGDLQAKLDQAAEQASNLESLINKVEALRAQKAPSGVVIVTAANGLNRASSWKGRLLHPVIGRFVEPNGRDLSGPGAIFQSQSGAQVIAPADSNVLFAGRYHNGVRVLILEIGDGYDLVLAGLDRMDVRPGDQLLAGEPLGTMPQDANASRLYFEVRHNGRAESPIPWMTGETKKARK
jgi:septal ring factor EnvC (AmiA/AmiB activator)